RSQVVCMVGDGGFMMTGNEMIAAVQRRLPILFILANNGSYASIRIHQERAYPARHPGTDLFNPDFLAIAQGFGMTAERVEREDQIESALQRGLQADGVPVTFTACYEPSQVLLAAALGVEYVAPYLGRICDRGRDGHAEVIRMQRCVDRLGSPLRLLVASLRQREDLARLAAEGLNTFTISPDMAEQLLAVEATLAAAAQFELDAAG
ncbi:MAG: thiamine pyrophosphate-dependent enzyme, partial [Vulcanococcus sp.]